jgi:hypothetical protein
MLDYEQLKTELEAKSHSKSQLEARLAESRAKVTLGEREGEGLRQKLA